MNLLRDAHTKGDNTMTFEEIVEEERGIKNVFDDLKDSINKKVKGVHVSVLADSDITSNRFYVKTPAYDLNRILSGSLYSGIPSRNLIAIVGPEHTMKSSFMVLCMAEAQKKGYKPVIIDTEGGITDEFCKRWGLDPEGVLYVYTPWISEVKSIIAQIKDSGDEEFIIGVDSVGGLDRLKSFDDAKAGLPKADQGLLQKEIRSTLKLLLNVCVVQNSVGIVCGHMYGMPSMIPMPDQIGGGKAMKLFPSIIISLKKAVIKDGTDIVGSEITATTLKNRMYPPFQQAKVMLNYKDGIEPCAGLIELGVEAGIIQKGGSWYSAQGERIGHGYEKAVKTLNDMPNIIEDIDNWLKNSGYSSINKQLEQANTLLEEAEGNSGVDLEKIIAKAEESSPTLSVEESVVKTTEEPVVVKKKTTRKKAVKKVTKKK